MRAGRFAPPRMFARTVYRSGEIASSRLGSSAMSFPVADPLRLDAHVGCWPARTRVTARAGTRALAGPGGASAGNRSRLRPCGSLPARRRGTVEQRARDLRAQGEKRPTSHSPVALDYEFRGRVSAETLNAQESPTCWFARGGALLRDPPRALAENKGTSAFIPRRSRPMPPDPRSQEAPRVQ